MHACQIPFSLTQQPVSKFIKLLCHLKIKLQTLITFKTSQCNGLAASKVNLSVPYLYFSLMYIR